ncbi:universal stress protein [Leifsonia poae]|uniref:Universal stress protein n=1 Tax=Leifsonia poae TaxID=110933 RepID=A0A9W6H9S1_9MICO|nr:universal stress protein [Leifsonia poae]GLJ76536.1 universal stress protein [Leifsonia poae]
MNDNPSREPQLDDRIHSGGRIVVGVDGSATSISALRRAAHIAEGLHCNLVGVTVWQFPQSWPGYQNNGWSPENDAKSIASDAADAVFGGQPPDWYSSVVREGSPTRQLLNESTGAEMLVVGSRGLGGFAGLLLGSVSSACAAHATCPVLVVHPKQEKATK